MVKDRKISHWEWGLIGAIAVLDLFFVTHTGLAIAPDQNILIALLCVVALWPAIAGLTRVTGFARGSQSIAENIAKFFLLYYAASFLEYQVVWMAHGPLDDPAIIKADAALGFDWPVFYAWVMAHPWVERILHDAYFSLELQIAAVLLGIAVVNPPRARSFLTVSFVATLLTLFVSIFFAVAGPFEVFHHTDLPQAAYTEMYRQLREHAITAIPMNDMRGVISLPSFHTASAIIMMFIFRGVPVLSPLVCLLNLGMMIGALVIGGHYLVDILAGALVGVLSVAVTLALRGRD